MENKKRAPQRAQIFWLSLLFGAFCFGCGVFFGQHMLMERGFVYEENAVESDASSEVAGVAKSGTSSPSSSVGLNINTAAESRLMQIEGIGSVTAKKIVSSREKDGPFETLHDLVDRGIMGEIKYSEVEAYLTVE